MRLCEHPDFDQAIIAAREHFGRMGLTEQLIEKDYYVTEALRLAAAHLAGRVIFKGGTSLSKGWGLIERFSEDIDLFVNPVAFHPTLGKNGINRELKSLRDAVAAHPALEYLPDISQTLGGIGRRDYFGYAQRFTGAAAVAPRVLLEVGTSSGTYPTEERTLASYVAAFLQETGRSLGAEDEAGFTMPLLHFRRTFVEKLFAIHAKVELFKRDGRPIGPYARHYYDLYCLAQRPEVQAMLRSLEYGEIKRDYEAISLRSFPRDYTAPEEMRFSRSDALYPPPALRSAIAADYEQQCRTLCYGAYPSWAEVEAVFSQLRDVL